MKIGISLLCEQPNRRTGLTSLFTAFVREALRLYDDVEFVFYCARGQGFPLESSRLTVRDGYEVNDRLLSRLYAEHFKIGPAAQAAGCDVLMTTGHVPLMSPLPIAMQLLTLHHLSPTNGVGPLRSAYRSWVARMGLRRAGLVITNTRFACGQILQVNPEVAPKLLQSYEGVDHSSFHPRGTAEERRMLKEKFGIQGSYFFWCSNFYPYKQAELLMEAWCDLPVTLREELPLVMVGGRGWGHSMDRTMEIARSRGATDQVKLLGWAADSEVPVLFRHASVFVHPSREETFGRSVLEAMASGVPCVVQGIPVMQEVTGGHAAMVDFADRTGTARVLEQAARDVEFRERLIRGGLQRAAEFSFERLVCERIQALRTLLKLPLLPEESRFPACYSNQF